MYHNKKRQAKRLVAKRLPYYYIVIDAKLQGIRANFRLILKGWRSQNISIGLIREKTQGVCSYNKSKDLIYNNFSSIIELTRSNIVDTTPVRNKEE